MRSVVRRDAEFILFEILTKTWNTVENMHVNILLITRYVEAT
jgi:hypothetical protein